MVLRSSSLPDLTLPALCEQYRRHALTVRNVSVYHVDRQSIYLKRLFEYFGPPRTVAAFFDGLKEEALTAFLIDYASGHGPGSRRNMHTTARTFLHFAYEEQFMAQDLSALVPTVRECTMGRIPKALPESCIGALEQSIERSCPEGRRDAAIICLLSSYGVRGVHVARLRLEHLDWGASRIHFPATKRGRPIEQHLTAKAGNRLSDYILNGRPESPHREVFLTLSTATPLADDPRVLWSIVDRRLRAAKLSVPENVSRGTRGFRHAFATRMTGKIPFKDVVDMLGHRNPSSTLVYAKVDVKTLRQAALPWPGVPE